MKRFITSYTGSGTHVHIAWFELVFLMNCYWCFPSRFSPPTEGISHWKPNPEIANCWRILLVTNCSWIKPTKSKSTWSSSFIVLTLQLPAQGILNFFAVLGSIAWLVGRSQFFIHWIFFSVSSSVRVPQWLVTGKELCCGLVFEPPHISTLMSSGILQRHRIEGRGEELKILPKKLNVFCQPSYTGLNTRFCGKRQSPTLRKRP